MDNQPGPVAAITLEQSEAQRMAAEAQAEQLRGQLAAANERADKAGALAALRESARTDGELSSIRRELAAMKEAHAGIAAKVEQSFGDNGVAVHDGVAHGSGAGAQADQQTYRIVPTYFSFSGQIDLAGIAVAYIQDANL